MAACPAENAPGHIRRYRSSKSHLGILELVAMGRLPTWRSIGCWP